MSNDIGTKENPWVLKTPPGTSEYTIYRDKQDETDILVCMVGKTKLTYDFKCIEDLTQMLKDCGDWVELGSKDEGKDPKPDTVEEWARNADNPIGGYYGLRKGYRGRFANYIPPLMEALGLAELTHEKRGNSMRAL